MPTKNKTSSNNKTMSTSSSENKYFKYYKPKSIGSNNSAGMIKVSKDEKEK